MTIVAMPEAAMREDDRLVAGKDNIRLSGKGAIMQPKAKPHRMEPFAQQKFRLRVGTTDTRHHPAANLSRDDVSHAR